MNDRNTSYYEYSLWKLYWKSGLIGAIIWAIAVVTVFVIGLFCRYETKEGLKLMAFMAVLGIVIVYAYPTACMIRTLKQQAATGIRWKDRREYDGEEMKRESGTFPLTRRISSLPSQLYQRNPAYSEGRCNRWRRPFQGKLCAFF